MVSEEVIDGILQKLEEIQSLSAWFIRYLHSVKTPQWASLDADLTVAKQTYTLFRTRILTSVQELPEV